MDIPLTIFRDIVTVDYGQLSDNEGELRVLLPRLIWRRKQTDRRLVMNIGEIQEVKWMVVHGSIQFSFYMKDGRSHRFTGFTYQHQAFLTNLFNNHEIPTQEEQCIVSGRNSVPSVSIRGNMLCFEVKRLNTMFEIPLSDVTSIETIGENDVEVKFHIDNTIGATKVEILTSVTLCISNTSAQFGGRVDSTPANVFKEWVNSLDCVRLGSEAPVATFERLLFVSPWGDYDMEFNLQFFGLRKSQIFVTILYRSIVSIHVLPKPKTQFVLVVICVDPPLQIGSEGYGYLVFQFKSDVMVDKRVQLLMSDELYASRFINKLERSYGGRVYEIVVSMLEGLSNIKRSDTGGSYGYGIDTTSSRGKAGVLYPLEDAFYHLPNPTRRILYDDINYIEIECPGKGLFNLRVVLNADRHYFDNLPKDELRRLADFLKSKRVVIRGYEDPASSSGSFKETRGFKWFSKSKKEEMEKEFPGLPSQAIALKMINRWIELPDEIKEFYEITGQVTIG